MLTKFARFISNSEFPLVYSKLHYRDLETQFSENSQFKKRVRRRREQHIFHAPHNLLWEHHEIGQKKKKSDDVT